MVWDWVNLNSQNQFYFLFFTLLGHITSVNNVVVTVLYLLRALHRRCKKINALRASLATAIYDKKHSDYLLSKSQGLFVL